MYHSSKEITIEKIACPLHIIALKKGLDSIDDNEVLKVKLGKANVGHELTAACHTLGHEVDSALQNNQTILYVRKSS